MTGVPGYPKIWALGEPHTTGIFETDHLIVQEKVDGSQFAFGIDPNGVIICRSHRQHIDMADPPKMFAAAVKQVKRMSSALIGRHSDTYFFAEYLEKPHHNVLSYARVPSNGLVLFDVMRHGALVQDRRELEEWAGVLEIDAIPQLEASRPSLDDLQELLTTPSYLGNETIEGVVIKNYDKSLDLYGTIMPVFAKLVRPAFKERHKEHWKPEAGLPAYLATFSNEARWAKAVIHAREEGLLENSPRDIGALMRLLAEDIEAEEGPTIREDLYKLFRKEIIRAAGRGFPEWYKSQLAVLAVAS